jgi:hypothetical protein
MLCMYRLQMYLIVVYIITYTYNDIIITCVETEHYFKSFMWFNNAVMTCNKATQGLNDHLLVTKF